MFKSLLNIVEAVVEVATIPVKIVDKVVVEPIKYVAKEINDALD